MKILKAMEKKFTIKLIGLVSLLFLGFALAFHPAQSQNNQLIIQKPNPSVKIYPNPVRDNLFLSIENITNLKVEVVIFNSLGGEMLRKNESADSSNDIKMNISNFKPGLYFAKITIDNQIYTRSFLKQ
jgi:hypothetical protein